MSKKFSGFSIFFDIKSNHLGIQMNFRRLCSDTHLHGIDVHHRPQVLREYTQDPCFHTQDQCQACWNELVPNSLHQAQPPANGCRAIPFVHATMDSRFFTGLRVRRHGTNRRPHSNNVPHISGTTQRSRSDGFERRN